MPALIRQSVPVAWLDVGKPPGADLSLNRNHLVTETVLPHASRLGASPVAVASLPHSSPENPRLGTSHPKSSVAVNGPFRFCCIEWHWLFFQTCRPKPFLQRVIDEQDRQSARNWASHGRAVRLQLKVCQGHSEANRAAEPCSTSTTRSPSFHWPSGDLSSPPPSRHRIPFSRGS
jgi:hypothetical protein